MEHPILEPEVAENHVSGIFEIADPNFGNLWTNIPVESFQNAGFAYGDMVDVTIRHEGEVVFAKKVLFHKSFGFVEKGEPIVYNNELMKVAVAISMGSMLNTWQLGFGPDWTVEFVK